MILRQTHALLNSENFTRTFLLLEFSARPVHVAITLRMKKRCHWATNERSSPDHDEEWGVPVHDDRTLFEFLILEGAQAGLSWNTILKKREHYRKVFDNFDPSQVARYDAKKTKQLLNNEGIIRNRLKIAAAIQNANA